MQPDVDPVLPDLLFWLLVALPVATLLFLFVRAATDGGWWLLALAVVVALTLLVLRD